MFNSFGKLNAFSMAKERLFDAVFEHRRDPLLKCNNFWFVSAPVYF